MTKFYITWSDRLGLFVNEYMPESSDSEEEEEEEDVRLQNISYFITMKQTE